LKKYVVGISPTVTLLFGIRPCIVVYQNPSIVLPDRIHGLRTTRTLDLPGRADAIFICSYASGQPYDRVVEAGVLVPSGVDVHVTADYRQGKIQLFSVSRNVALTGYLSENEYINLHSSAELVMDLTDRADWLVCGACEAVALHEAMVPSHAEANRYSFDRGCVYASYNLKSLARAVPTGLERRDQLGVDVSALEAFRRREREALQDDLLERIADRARETIPGAPSRDYSGPCDEISENRP
jgi:hypothetical protein